GRTSISLTYRSSKWMNLITAGTSSKARVYVLFLAVIVDRSLLPFPDLVARHGIEPYPLAFQTSTLPSSSRAKLGGRCETRTRISRLQAVGNPLIRTAHLGRDERIELSWLEPQSSA